jgi:hypothetical protein
VIQNQGCRVFIRRWDHNDSVESGKNNVCCRKFRRQKERSRAATLLAAQQQKRERAPRRRRHSRRNRSGEPQPTHTTPHRGGRVAGEEDSNRFPFSSAAHPPARRTREIGEKEGSGGGKDGHAVKRRKRKEKRNKGKEKCKLFLVVKIEGGNSSK